MKRSGIIKVIKATDLVYSLPDEDALDGFARVVDCTIDVNNIDYPYHITLISYSSLTRSFIKQGLSLDNKGQIKHVFGKFAQNAAIIPTHCLSDEGKNLPNDQIISDNEISNIKNMA